MNSIFTAFSNAGCTTEVFSPAPPLRSLLTHRKASLISWRWFINLLSACCSARKMSSAEAAPGAGMCRRVQTSWVPERGRWTGRRARTQAPSGFQACMALMVFAFLSPPQVQILVPLLKLYSRLSDHKLSEKKMTSKTENSLGCKPVLSQVWYQPSKYTPDLMRHLPAKPKQSNSALKCAKEEK